MAWVYPRDRKKIIVLNGIWDPMDDQTFSKSLWSKTHNDDATSYVDWDMVSAPGGVGGYAIWIKGEIQNAIKMKGVGGVSCYRALSTMGAIPLLSPYIWNTTIEFRLRIVQDQGSPLSNREVSHSAGFAIDGAVLFEDDPSGTMNNRMGCFFNVANQKAGLTVNYHDLTTEIATAYTHYSVDWSGSYDTWYDIRIEVDYNWWTNPQQYYIQVWVNNTRIINQTFDFLNQWRSKDDTPSSDTEPWHWNLGRPGPQLINENDDTVNITNGTFVEAYWKDILITNRIKLLRWDFSDSILGGSKEVILEGFAVADYPAEVSKGSDIQIWLRETTSDPWNGFWRGVIKETNKVRSKFVQFVAEGYMSHLFSEKTENLVFTTQNANTIMAGAINNPSKPEFDTSTFFDTHSTTYTRTYRQHPKISIIEEMQALENGLVFLDMGNNWHFEEYNKNQLNLHLEYGQSRLVDCHVSHITIRRPTHLRVVGSGVFSESEIAIHKVDGQARIYRNINRLDLTTQAEVDDARDYYMSLFLEDIKVVDLTLRANLSVKKGHLIRLTYPDKGFQNTQFLVVGLSLDHVNRMSLELIEARPHVALLLAEMNERLDSKESEMVAADTVAADTNYNVEAVINTYIGGEFEVISGSTILRSGKVTVTDAFIEDIIELFNDESPQEPTNLAYGTGTTEPYFSDTVLETETNRASATVAGQERIDLTQTGPSDAYRAVEFKITVGGGVTNLTEMGIFNNAIGGDMAARCVFASYTEAGSVDLVIRLRIIPEPGPNMMTQKGVQIFSRWLRNIATFPIDWMTINFSENYSPPSIYMDSHSEYWGNSYWWPQSDPSMTSTKLPNRYMLKLEQSLTFGNVPDKPLWCIWVGKFNSWKPFIVSLRSGLTGDNFDNKTWKATIWLRFIPGELAP